MKKNRIETFSDGVFSVAATLLIVPLIPTNPAARLDEILQSLPLRAGVYAMSFLIVGVYWVAHNRFLARLKTVDHNILWLNIITLMLIGFIPLPTAALAGHPFEPTTIALYGCTLAAVNVSGTLTWLAISLSANAEIPRRTAKLTAIIHIAPAVTYLAAAAFGSVMPFVSLLIFLATPLFFMLPHPFLARVLKSDDPQDRV